MFTLIALTVRHRALKGILAGKQLWPKQNVTLSQNPLLVATLGIFSPVSNARLQYSHFHTFKFPARRSFLPSQSYDGGYDVTALLWRPRCALEQSTCKLKLTEHVELDCVLDAVFEFCFVPSLKSTTCHAVLQLDVISNLRTTKELSIDSVSLSPTWGWNG